MDKETYQKANKIHGEILNATGLIQQVKLMNAITPKYSRKKLIRELQEKIKKLEQEFEEI